MNADEDWLHLLSDAAREDARQEDEIVARLLRTDEGKRLLAPLDDGARARIVAAAFPAARRPRARVIALGAGGALAAAAAFVLWVGAAGRAAPLPPYEVSVSGPASALRGAPTPADPSDVELHAASPFELVLRPSDDVKGPIAADAFVVEAGQARAWPAPIEISSEGAVRIAGRTDALFPRGAGERDLLVIVTRPGAMPDAAHALAVAATPSESRRVARLHVRISP